MDHINIVGMVIKYNFHTFYVADHRDVIGSDLAHYKTLYSLSFILYTIAKLCLLFCLFTYLLRNYLIQEQLLLWLSIVQFVFCSYNLIKICFLFCVFSDIYRQIVWHKKNENFPLWHWTSTRPHFQLAIV